jgi:hypothetical protein
MSPAESSCDQTGFRFPYTGPLPVVCRHRMRPPGLGTSPFLSVLSPTPRCEQTVRLSVDPRLLSAFPRRRYGRLTQLRITRLIRVHGYYSPLICIFVQGHLSRRLAPSTRPPARSPNGRLGSGDLHPMSLSSVPACRRLTGHWPKTGQRLGMLCFHLARITPISDEWHLYGLPTSRPSDLTSPRQD